jgi:HlyD family secretion protein
MGKIGVLWKKIKNSRRRTKIIGVIAILIVLFLILRGNKKPVAIQYQIVSKNDIQSTITASGILSGKNVATLHFNGAGKLNYLPVKNGDIVKKGQVIASLDTTALNAALQEAINNRRNTQANADYIHDQVKDHSGDETFAQKATRTAAEVANDNAYDSVIAAKKALADATIYSPISGIVVSQDDITPGQNITPTNIVAKIVDFSNKDFEATVDESDIGNVHIGQSAKVTLNAYGDTEFSGNIVEVESQTQTDATGSVTVTVKIELNDPKISDIYGLNGQATIITNSKKNVITISQDALISDSEVYVKNSAGKPEKRTIQTGIKSDSDVEIVSGLTEGEQVVINPQAVAK